MLRLREGLYAMVSRLTTLRCVVTKVWKLVHKARNKMALNGHHGVLEVQLILLGEKLSHLRTVTLQRLLRCRLQIRPY